MVDVGIFVAIILGGIFGWAVGHWLAYLLFEE